MNHLFKKRKKVDPGKKSCLHLKWLVLLSFVHFLNFAGMGLVAY